MPSPHLYISQPNSQTTHPACGGAYNRVYAWLHSKLPGYDLTKERIAISEQMILEEENLDDLRSLRFIVNFHNPDVFMVEYDGFSNHGAEVADVIDRRIMALWQQQLTDRMIALYCLVTNGLCDLPPQEEYARHFVLDNFQNPMRGRGFDSYGYYTRMFSEIFKELPGWSFDRYHIPAESDQVYIYFQADADIQSRKDSGDE